MKIKKMFLNSIVRERHLIGVDIERDFVRLVALSFDGQRYRVDACINLDRQEPNDSDVVGIIKNVLNEQGIKTRLIVIALSHADVVFKKIDVAADLSSKQLEDFLRFNLVKDTKLMEDRIIFDYQVVDGIESSDVAKMIQVVAVEREHVESKIKLFKKTGMLLKAIDVDIYAMERAVRYQLKNIKGLVGVINIDCNRMLILVLDCKKIVHVYEDVIVKDELKLLEDLVKQIDLRLQLVFSSLSQPINKIVLAGEKGSLLGLAEAVNSKFNIQTIIANPFFDMELSLDVSLDDVKKAACMMLISCGLALRVGVDDNKY